MPVLIVEDDPDTRETLLQLMQLKGLTVKSAENGQEAWDLLAAGERPCLILMDLMMPVLSGWELRERMLADEELRKLPVVILSATADSASTLGAVAVLSKPVEFDELERLVLRYCRRDGAGGGT